MLPETALSSVQNEALAALNNRFFHLILLPTEKCNFHCTYCYEEFKIGKMNRSTINGVKALLDSKLKLIRHLHVEWFGGEPLLALPIVQEISEHIIGLTSVHQDVVYHGSMTTNGYLLRPETFERLVALGITSYQISLDGDEEGHNSTRLMLNGGNSFQVIWQNLKGMHRSKANMEVVLRVHLFKDNIGSVEALLEELASEFGKDPRFKVFFRRVEKLGGPNDASFPTLTHHEEERVIKRLIDAVSSRLNVFNLEPKADLKNHICYAARANSLAIRADGRIAKCTVALYDERNSVGRIREDGTLQLDRARFMPWLRGLESLNPEELACPYQGL